MVDLSSLHRLEVEAEVLGRVLGVGDHDDLVVEHNHTPVMGRHDLLEVVVCEILPPERLGARPVGRGPVGRSPGCDEIGRSARAAATTGLTAALGLAATIDVGKSRSSLSSPALVCVERSLTPLRMMNPREIEMTSRSPAAIRLM
jgi:hypothetical protein